ncbi:DUF4407 domain-containing protein [Mucilaginibacter terrenus]|uniref:DUF4407 domain-containing protein n=1 Tax=Mucilaginibacter terrenus TaxID=2482727 RepID=A0A3E2NU42_9SPHI|nr:DUF4407 domain-containing protein [Mucilaginibacter terrenus]RFZ84528.1 DUF4407 domain-containing protein [Mucilaginibacter terrenus]
MKSWWIKFGCFLTGYNFNIINVSSEVSAKAVKRYTSAMLIVCILWSFIGFVFTQRYLKTGFVGAIFGAIVLCVIIIQVERQIILAVKKDWKMYAFRSLIALTMAIIGSVIIDQIIFKEDIEQKQLYLLDSKVNQILPNKQAELKKQIAQLDTIINAKESERKKIVEDISLHPTIKNITTQTQSIPVSNTVKDSLNTAITNTKIVKANSITVNSINNPKIELLTPLNKQIEQLRASKSLKDNQLLALRPSLEKEIQSKVGFLDELNVMFLLITGSGVALFVWLLWLIFLLCIELFIMMSKIGEEQNDYDATVLHQMELQKKKLLLLSNTN